MDVAFNVLLIVRDAYLEGTYESGITVIAMWRVQRMLKLLQG